MIQPWEIPKTVSNRAPLLKICRMTGLVRCVGLVRPNFLRKSRKMPSPGEICMKERSNDKTGTDDIDSIHVLVVDDEPIICDLLQAMLGSMQVSVEVAENGIEAQRKVLSCSYQLVITDINMPEMDGITLLRWLNQRKPDIEVIVMTGYALTEEMLKTIGDTATAYFVKPLEPVKIRAVVQHCRERIKEHNHI
jgi:CheY-like chemotaxis protein